MHNGKNLNEIRYLRPLVAQELHMWKFSILMYARARARKSKIHAQNPSPGGKIKKSFTRGDTELARTLHTGTLLAIAKTVPTYSRVRSPRGSPRGTHYSNVQYTRKITHFSTTQLTRNLHPYEGELHIHDPHGSCRLMKRIAYELHTG